MISKTVGWRMKENTPWLGVPRGFRLNRDHWLAGAREKEWLKEALEGFYKGSSSIVEDSLILIQKAYSPSGGFGGEVYAHAARLGLLAYEDGAWRFYPTGALASLLESTGTPTISVEYKGRLKGRKITLPECPEEAGYVIISQRRYVGPAKIIERNPCIVRVKDMAPRGFKPLPSSSIEDAVNVNRAYIERLAAEAREFIKAHAGSGRVYVAVSGGLDSSAALSLAVEAVGRRRVVAVYADTGMEFPESKRTVEELAETLGVDLDIVSPQVDPVEEIARRGLMGKEYRWCTRLLKLEPLRGYYEARGARIVVDGARALESESRALTPRVGVNPVIPGVKRLLPIHSWSRLEVQLYAYLKGLPVNPVYDRGLHRIGCMLCPAMHIHEMRVSMELSRGFYQRIYKVLRELGIRDPEEFLLRGEWRRLGVRASR